MKISNGKENGFALSLVSISMMFMVLGITIFESTKWLKFLLLILAVIIAAIAFILLLRDSIKKIKK